MDDPVLAPVSAKERRAAMNALNALMTVIGRPTGEVSAIDLLRLLTFASAIILDASPELISEKDFEKNGSFLGSAVTHHAQVLRRERDNTGLGLFEMIGTSDKRDHH